MAREAFRSLLRFAEAQNLTHTFAHRLGQGVVGFRVLIFHRPDAVFVLKNAAVRTRCDAAVAACRTTGAGTGVLATFGRRLGRARWLQFAF